MFVVFVPLDTSDLPLPLYVTQCIRHIKAEEKHVFSLQQCTFVIAT